MDERLLKSSQDITTLNRLVKIVEDLEEADESTTDVLEVCWFFFDFMLHR